MTNRDNSGRTGVQNLWAPWRMEYIDGLSEEADDCFLCRYRDQRERDEENLVLWRRGDTLAVMNRFPYTGGHLLIAPTAHVGNLEDIQDHVLLELMHGIRDAQRILDRVVHAEGFNIGINIGRCAGAGLPGHLHVHVVPRWGGDTNFMSVLGDVRVIPQALQELYDRLGQEVRRAALTREDA